MQKIIDPNRLGLVDYKTCQLYLQQCQVVGMQEKISVSCHSLRQRPARNMKLDIAQKISLRRPEAMINLFEKALSVNRKTMINKNSTLEN